MSANTNAVTDATFEAEVLKSKVPVLVDFWAEWCAPCRALAPTLEEVATEFKDKIKVVKINIDENPGAPSQFGVRSIPTLIVFKAGQQVDQSLGNIPKSQVVSLVNKVLG
jgi:thioredoxin 1